MNFILLGTAIFQIILFSYKILAIRLVYYNDCVFIFIFLFDIYA